MTEDIKELAQSIGSKMEDNEVEHVEILQSLMEKRQEVISQLDNYIQQPGFHWNTEDRKMIAELKQHDTTLQPLLNGLHRSFLAQINRLNQTKQVSKKYYNAYQQMATDGSFIDKRK